MDKLTIEQKAKAYDEAIRKAQDVLHTSEFINITDLFPELKESADEKVRKELIDYFKENNAALAFRGISNECVLAWLEKQGKQKPAEKVEPKFKAGNWYQCTKDFFGKGVTFDNNTAYYCAEEGCLQNEYGCHIAIVKDLYDNFKLWTIDDAKDGDVLYTPKEAGVEGIFLIEGWKQVECTGKTLFSIIGYRVEDDKIVTGGLGAIWWKGVIAPFYPATKEQCYLLFQKMREAGYEWDAEKKGLKKIEQKSATMSLDEAINKHCEEKSCGNNACALEHKQLEKWLTELKELKEQKPWSEDDENRFNNLIFLVENSNEGKGTKEGFIKFINRLKSLKDRVYPRPKQEWSKEDERMIISISNYLERQKNYQLNKTNIEQCQEWLNSLKQKIDNL